MIALRDELPGDAAAIAALIARAFASAPHADGNEAQIVAGLRRAGALALSLVATDEAAIVGHVAVSPVTLEHGAAGWFGLGPVAVEPVRQREGIGARLIEQGLARLRAIGAMGCVVLGDPAYYGRFGFVADPLMRYAGAPAIYFQALAFRGEVPATEVTYHPAFG